MTWILLFSYLKAGYFTGYRMKLRRLALLCIVTVLFISMASGANLQKTYLLTDDLWIRADRLCREAGYLGPAPVSPTTGAEIKRALDRLDRSLLTQRQQAEYDSIIAELTESDRFSFRADFFELDVDGTVGLQFYGFNNTKSTYANEFFIPYRDRIPFLTAELHSYFGDLLYLDFQYLFEDSPAAFGVGADGSLIAGDLFYNFSNMSMIASPGLDGKWHTLNFMSSGHIYTMNVYQPFKLGASIGNSFLNAYFGRTRQAMGNGITGNLVIGDNFRYQETLKLSAFSDIFSYYLTLTHFDNVYSISDYSTSENNSFMLNGQHQNRVMHRFDFNILNKVRFAINIGGLFVSDNAFDLRLLLPMMLVHNWCNNREEVEVAAGDEGNNIMGFELEWAITQGWFMSAQLVIDQLQVAGESGSSVPNAFGVLANAKNTTALRNGTLDSWIEFVYTNPYLYLNYKETDGKPNYNYDWIVGYGFPQNTSMEIGYAGHPYGPDTIALAIGTLYTDKAGWDVSGSMMYKVHGEHGIKWNYWSQNDSNRVEEGGSFDFSTPTGVPEHTLAFTAGGGYEIIEGLKVSVAATAFFQWNYHNQQDVFKASTQCAIGLVWEAL